MTEPRTPITIGIIVTFLFHSIFPFAIKVLVLIPSFHILSISLCDPPEQQSPQFCEFSFFILIIIIKSGCLTEIRGSVLSQNPWGVYAETVMYTILQVIIFLLLIIIWSGLMAEIRWSVCMSKSHRTLCQSFSRTDSGCPVSWGNRIH